MREIQLPAGDEERREEWHLWKQRVRRAQLGRIHVREHAQHDRARARGPLVCVPHGRPGLPRGGQRGEGRGVSD